MQFTHKVVTSQLQIRRRAVKVRRSKTDILTTELCRQPKITSNSISDGFGWLDLMVNALVTSSKLIYVEPG